MIRFPYWAICLTLFTSAIARADVGDPQIRTDHPYYPGELACSTFERLFATQAELYKHVVGVKPTTDEQKALAAWLWRNTHYFHAEDGAEDLWGQGINKGADRKNREYWAGLFSNGFSLCGTTHAQWVGEMEALLGRNRARVTGVDGHNSFEVFLKGGTYGDGKWALLDHDLSTVIYSKDNVRLMSLKEISQNWKQLTDRNYLPLKQQGWLVCGLDPRDGASYSQYRSAEYGAGYSGPPPMVHLRRGETLRRYLQPGLEDGNTFVFWGYNYKQGGIAGPARAQTWVNQPEKMYRSTKGTPFKAGQARYGNAVFTYKPDFNTADYREGLISETDNEVVFEYVSPYTIGATPANDKPWGTYDEGCKNGLILRGKAACTVAVSVDRGRNWINAGNFADGLDLTDYVKGRRQYQLKLSTGAKALANAGLSITTVCQSSSSVIPRLKDDGSVVNFAASNQSVVSAGPNLPQAESAVIDGKFGSPTVTLELKSPRGEKPVGIHAAAHVASGNPPRAEVKYQIDMSQDGGKTWQPIIKDWTINQQGEQPADFWSQSIHAGSKALTGDGPVQVRFSNSHKRTILRGEAHLVYQTKPVDRTKVTFAWTEDGGAKQASHTFTSGDSTAWKLPTGKNVQTRWVEFEAVNAR